MPPLNNTTVGVRLRSLLLDHPDGLTIDQMSRMIKHPYDCVAPVLHRTYGCYIAEWRDHPDHYHLQVPVWKCVTVPVNAVAKIEMKKPAKEKPTPAEKPVYKPQKTVWVTVPSWDQV